MTFYEDSDETANGIHQAQMNCLKKYELDIKHITAYAADNANVNFGKCHSVSQLLSSADSHILKANCPAHIAHNTCKHACDQLSVDIESLVLKIYSRFSVSASREGNCVHFLLLLPLSGEKFCFMFACDGRLSIPLLIVSCRAGQLSPHTSGPVGETCPLYLSRIFEDEDKTAAHEIYLYTTWGVFLTQSLKSWRKQSSASEMCTGWWENSKRRCFGGKKTAFLDTRPSS